MKSSYISIHINKSVYVVLMLLVMLLTGNSANAQKKDENHFNTKSSVYKKKLKLLRKFISKDKGEEVKDTSVPEAFRQESMVFLYHRKEMYCNRKYTLIFDHLRVKLNDQAAVESFSSYPFSDFGAVDIKIIKPDNSVKRINLKDAVRREITLKTKNHTHTLLTNNYDVSIKGLEVGDIIEIANFLPVSVYDLKFADFLNQEYPQVYLKLEVITTRKSQFFGRWENNSPKIKSYKEKRGVYRYVFEDRMVEKYKPAIKGIRTLDDPYLRFQVQSINAYAANGFKPAKGMIKTSVSGNEMAGHIRQNYNLYIKPHKGKLYKKFIKEFGKTLSDEEFIINYYYYLRDYYFSSEVAFGQKGWANELYMLEVMAAHASIRGISSRFVLLPNKFRGGENALLFEDNYKLGVEILVPGKSIFLTSFNPWSHPDIIPTGAQGEEAYTFQKKELKKRKAGEKITLEKSKPEDNQVVLEINASYPVNTDTLVLKETVSFSGNSIDQRNELGVDYEKAIRECDKFYRIPRFHNKRYPLLYFVNKWHYRKKTDKAFYLKEEERLEKEYIADKNRKRKEKLTESFKDEYTLYKLDSVFPVSDGRSPLNKSVSFYVELKIDGGISKSGNKYLINAGALLGSTPEINLMKNRKDRTKPFYNETDNAITYKIALELPYYIRVTDLSQLNRKFENKTGSFESVAVMEGKTLKWEIKFVETGFKHEASEWNDYLALTDEFAKIARVILVSE